MNDVLSPEGFTELHAWINKNHGISHALSTSLLEQIGAEQLSEYDDDNEDEVFLVFKDGDVTFYDNHRSEIIAWMENKFSFNSDYYSSIEEMVWRITDLDCEDVTPADVKGYMYSPEDVKAADGEYYKIYQEMMSYLLASDYFEFYERFVDHGRPSIGKTLKELAGDNKDLLDMNMHDLKKARHIIQEWVEGEDVNAEFAFYIGMLCMGLSKEVEAKLEQE